MDQILKVTEDKDEWFRITLYRLIEICKRAASKYTRSKAAKPCRRILPTFWKS